MRSSQFQQVMERTDELLRILQQSQALEEITEVDRLIEERELLMQELHRNLRNSANIEAYRNEYESLQLKELELSKFIQQSLLHIESKITKFKNVKNTSGQYNSYLRQMPYGAFLDSKK